MNVIVTGSSGFIGRHVVADLKFCGHEVIEVDIDSGIDVTSLDDHDFVDIDAVIHLAAYSLIKSRENPAEAFRVNVGGLVHILELCAKHDVKLIMASASSVYGVPDYVPVNESHKLNPVSIYGVSKRSMESIVDIYHKTKGLDYLIFRFTNVYGPGQVNGIVPASIDNVKNDLPITLTGTGTQTRDFVFIDDVVHFVVRGLENDKTGIFNLGSGTETSMITLVHAIGEHVGNAPIVLYTASDEDERERFCASVRKLRGIFKQVPMTSLNDGLIATIGDL
jgi:UDP-glucose 4-epimerase